MSLTRGAGVAVLFAWLSYYFYQNVYVLTEFGKELPDGFVDNARCTLKHGNDGRMVGSEDLALWKHGLLFISSGDLATVFEHGGAGVASPGGMYVMNVSGPTERWEPVRMHLRGLPQEDGVAFQPHGIFVSNATDRLFVVCHRGRFSSVEVFGISLAAQSCQEGDHPCVPATLTHVTSVRSTMFPNSGINDVVEGPTAGDFFVSQWLAFPLPPEGKEGLGIANLLITLLKVRPTKIFRCSFDDTITINREAACDDATGPSFVGANGLATTKDRSRVLVADSPRKRVSVMRPTEEGRLELVRVFEPKHIVDNMYIEENSGDLVLGSIPLPATIFRQKVLKDHSIAIPGGMLVARRKPHSASDEKDAWDEWIMGSIADGGEFNHDGNVLSQVSAAVRFGSHVILGSPFSKGILVCAA